MSEKKIALKGRRLMIVDDDRRNLSVLKDILEQKGYNISFATDGKAALRIIPQFMPDIILLDVVMPDIDGFEVCRRLKANKKTNHIPVIFLTVKREIEDIIKGFKIGGSDYIVKPFQHEEVCVRVQTHLQLKLEIEKRKNAQKKLHHMNLELKQRIEENLILYQVVDQSPIVVMITDTEGSIEYVNPRFTQLTGYTSDEVMGENPRILKTGDTPKEEYERLWDTITSGRQWRGEFHNRKKNGELYWESALIFPIKNKEGTIAHFLALKEDITREKKLEEALQKAHDELEMHVIERTRELKEADKKVSEEKTEGKAVRVILTGKKNGSRVTVHSIGDGVIATDAEGKIVIVNKVAEKLIGWHQEQVLKKHLSEVFHIIDEKTREQCKNPCEKVMETGDVIDLGNETILIARDGTERILAGSAAPIHDSKNTIIGMALVFRDITEKRRLDEERIKAQKQESIGVLAGGIAHDFNNLLTSILGNISLAKLFVSHGDKIYERLVEAEKASLRAKDLTQQLLTFSQGGVPVKKISAPGELIKEAASLALKGSNVRCEFSIPGNLWTMEVDQGQISQVINNLIINASQAMADGGIIEVKCENITLDTSDTFPLKAGKYIKLSIKDHGIGIVKDHLQKIFDPYFTTKPKGSGLGLAICYSIVKNHKGHICVESEVGVGTTFSIYLPASGKKVVKATSEKDVVKEKKSLSLKSNGRILLMDDDEFVREVTSQVLLSIGYKVQSVKDGKEAIEYYRKAGKEGQPFDAVILDLTVPAGMGGKETIKELRKTDPDIKAIVSSGYCNDPIMTEFKKYGFRGVITKPYKLKELSEVLHKVISKTD